MSPTGRCQGCNHSERVRIERLLTYIHIPVDFQNPTDQDFDQFCAVMEKLMDVPVHVHCIANYRVSAFYRTAGMCLEWTRPARGPTWKMFGTQRASGRRL